MMQSQVGGKYHPEDDSVFRVKRVLVEAGVAVSHPLADKIQASDDSHAYAFDPTQHSFGEIEQHYYDCIRTSDFHTVCNQFKDRVGYLGGSASLEVAYAMCHGRPIVALHPAAVNPDVESAVRSFLGGRLHLVVNHDFLQATRADNVRFLSQIEDTRVDYGVGPSERKTIDQLVQTLLTRIGPN